MTRRTEHAFTLVELLVVIAILGILIGLLMPAFAGVYESWRTTRCKLNLEAIWKGHGLCRADRQSGRFASGQDWTSQILPYLEDRSEVFTCPAGLLLTGFSTETVTGLKLHDIYFKIYKGTTFLYTIHLDAGMPVIKVTDLGGGKKRYGIEDLAPGGGGDDWNDIVVDVHFKGSAPVYLEFQPNSGHSYWYELFVGKDFVEKIASNGTGTSRPLKGHGWAASDYGMSRGCYEVTSGDVPAVDSKLFFIMDYPKTVADYSEATGGDVWPQFFVVDPKANPVTGQYAWKPPEGFEDCVWQQVTALRHGRKVNVLFCDGHVESLGIDPVNDVPAQGGKSLVPTSPLWRYRTF